MEKEKIWTSSLVRDAERSLKTEDKTRISSLQSNLHELGLSKVDALSSLLHLSVKNNLHEIANWLLDEGADPNFSWESTTERKNVTPLETAVYSRVSNRRTFSSRRNPTQNEQNDLASIQLLLSRGASAHAKNCSLIIASNLGRSDIIKILVESGADINYQDEHGNTPLLCASQHFDNKPECIEILLQLQSNPTIVNKQRNTILHKIAGKSQTQDSSSSRDIITRLIQSGVGLNDKNSQGETPLSKAVRQGNILVASALLEHITVDQILSQNNQGLNAVHEATIWCHIPLLKLLINKSSDRKTDIVNSIDLKGNTPLHLLGDSTFMGEGFHLHGTQIHPVNANAVAHHTHTTDILNESAVSDILNVLLESGANVSALNHAGQTVVHNGNVSWSKLNALIPLVSSQMNLSVYDLLSKTDSNNMTPFLLSVKSNQTEHVNNMLKMVSSQSHDISSDRQAQQLVQSISTHLESLYPSSSDKSNTILHSAASNQDYSSLLQLLLEHGGLRPFINKKNLDNQTPLHCAIVKDAAANVELLLQEGADSSILSEKKRNFASWDNVIDKMRQSILAQEGIVEDNNQQSDTKDTIDKPLSVVELALEHCSVASLVPLLKRKLASEEELNRVKQWQDESGETLLHKAVRLSDSNALQDLLDVLIASEETNNNNQNNPTAIQNNAFSDTGTLLHNAAQGGHDQSIKILLDFFLPRSSDKKELLDSQSHPEGFTPLHLAARFGHPNAVKALLDAGADPTQRDPEGFLPVDYVEEALGSSQLSEEQRDNLQLCTSLLNKE